MTKDIRAEGDAADLQSLIPALPHARQWLSLWSTPESFAAHVGTIDPAKAWHGVAWDDNKAFRGTSSMAEAIALARDGWPEGAKRAAAMRDRINAANPTGPRVVRWDVAGAVASVPRALAGNPLSMRRIDTAKLRRRPVVTLLSDMTAPWRIAGNVLANRAAVVAAVVDAVEAAGYSAQVIGAAGTGVDKTLAAFCAVTLKESDQPADIGRLAFGLGHPAMFRRLMFAIYGNDSFNEDLKGNLGFPITIDPSDKTRAADVYVLTSPQKGESYFETEQRAGTAGLKFLIDDLTAQGCPAFPAVDARAA